MLKIAKSFVVSSALCASAFAQSSGWLGDSPAGANPAKTAAPVQSAAQSAPAPSAQNAAPAQHTGFFESSTFERTADKIFDTNKDSLDLENGTLNWKGKTFTLGDSRIVRARFERYLSMPPAGHDYQAYQAILSEIVARLAANNDALSEDVLRACWNRLFDAAEYDVDGKASLTIANLVYLSWRMRGEYKIAKSEEAKQEKTAADAKEVAKGKARFLEYAADKIAAQNEKKSKKQHTLGTTDLAYNVKDYQEEIAALASKKIERQIVAARAKGLFQSQIAAFLMERKFLQAQIASMFYRHIYRGKAQELEVGREQLKDFFPVSDFVPSVDTLENLATEARKDVHDGMAAVNALCKDGEMFGALERLMETFPLGEFDPELAVFPFEKRKKLLKIYKDMRAMKSLADSKDWAGIVEILEDFKTAAPDFPSREALAKVRTAQRVSEMHVMAAKQAAALGKVAEVKESLAEAMRVWPLNPSIAEFNKDLVGLASGASKYVQKFDDLLARKNYREINAEAPEYAIALKSDPERSEELRKIVVRLSQIDIVIAQAQEFEKQNNRYLAWDILETARALDPNDPKLAVAVAKLAPEVSDYVKALGKAKAAEDAREYAAALNYYLAAQEIFPASQACRLGIERVAPKYGQ